MHESQTLDYEVPVLLIKVAVVFCVFIMSWLFLFSLLLFSGHVRLHMISTVIVIGTAMVLMPLTMDNINNVLPVVVTAIPYGDEITSLPLVGTTGLPAKQFSGYLNGTDGCNIAVNGPYCYIHYWFCLAEYDDDDSDDDEDTERDGSSKSSAAGYVNDYPIIVWFNGGPGSSSILGLLQELGPLLFNATGDGFMSNNPYSYTKLPANLLILESPIGVGYSYCSKQEVIGERCINTDHYTATTAHAAIVDFVTNQFPEYQNNPIYITGESYAGVYIPTLVQEIIHYNNNININTNTNTHNSNHHKKINLIGIAVGDPCTDNNAQYDSMDALWYSNKYGLMDDQIYDTLTNICQVRDISSSHRHQQLRDGRIQIPSIHDTKNGSSRSTDPLLPVHMKIQEQLQKYSIVRRNRRLQQLRRNRSSNNNSSMTTTTTLSSVVNVDNDDNIDQVCDLAYKKFLLSSSNGLSQGWGNRYINDYNLFGFVSDNENHAMINYMNRRDVREALHVTRTPHVQHWPYPDAGFDYTKEYNACNDDAMHTNASSMIDFYRTIIPYLQTTIIYNGDTDPCVSYEGTRTAIQRIGLPELDGGSYRPWFYNHTATTKRVLQEKAITFGPNLVLHEAGIQFGGEIISYDKNLSFLTIHGSGHMVPQYRPQAAFHMMLKLVQDQIMSPLLPSNATLMNVSDIDFVQLMDEWTVRAKSLPYVG